jgi:hypothetical protein
VIDFQRKDAQPVDCPCGTLGIESGIGLDDNIAVFWSEELIYLLHKVGAVLVRAVDATFQLQSLYGIDMRIADDILKVPLYGVNPALQIESVLNGITFVGIINGRFDIIFNVIVGNGLIENLVTLFCE